MVPGISSPQKPPQPAGAPALAWAGSSKKDASDTSNHAFLGYFYPMKKIAIILVLAALGFLAYRQYGPKRPEFRGIRKVQVEEVSNKKMVLVAEAVVFNPNIVGIEVSSVDLDVLVNGVKIGKAVAAGPPAQGPAGEEFAVPVRAEVHPGQLLQQGGLLGGLGALLGTGQTEYVYQGTLTVQVLFASFDVEVKESGKPAPQ
jgi:hypothetical protein